MGDWPLLADEERMEGVERLVAAGVPVIVGTGAQNTKRAAALAAHAKTCGAAGLMIIPRVLSRGSSVAAQRAHFDAVLSAAIDLERLLGLAPGAFRQRSVFRDIAAERVLDEEDRVRNGVEEVVGDEGPVELVEKAFKRPHGDAPVHGLPIAKSRLDLAPRRAPLPVRRCGSSARVS
jgi:hypothetical protein